METDSRRVELYTNFDVVTARQYARELSREIGFGLTDQTRIATAVSEVCRRALENRGEIVLTKVMDGPRRGMQCVCWGSEWLESPSGAPTGEILGGLRGVERLMDEFELQTDRDDRTVVIMRKWLR